MTPNNQEEKPLIKQVTVDQLVQNTGTDVPSGHAMPISLLDHVFENPKFNPGYLKEDNDGNIVYVDLTEHPELLTAVLAYLSQVRDEGGMDPFWMRRTLDGNQVYVKPPVPESAYGAQNGPDVPDFMDYLVDAEFQGAGQNGPG